MYKEPISHIYRTRGKAGRIKRMKKKYVYNMLTSDILRVVDKQKELFYKAVPFKVWRKNKQNDKLE